MVERFPQRAAVEALKERKGERVAIALVDRAEDRFLGGAALQPSVGKAERGQRATMRRVLVAERAADGRLADLGVGGTDLVDEQIGVLLAAHITSGLETKRGAAPHRGRAAGRVRR
jgi:hypothetical protein